MQLQLGNRDWWGNSTQIKYDYTCCKVPKSIYTQTACVAKSTSLSDDGSGDVNYLDHHDVLCSGAQYLQRMHMSRAGTSDKIQYEYTCCSFDSSAVKSDTALAQVSRSLTPANVVFRRGHRH